MQLIDGKAIAGELKAQCAQESAALQEKGIVPSLTVILVGEDPASQVYVRNKENACIKASAIQKLAGGIVLADDSGLEVDYLGGAPGIYSARYMGEDTSYDIKNQAIIDKLEKAVDDERSARFVCAIAAALPDGEVLTTRGTIEGRIGYEIIGDGGFGYDPIFYLPERGLTTAQLSAEEKNEISHRGRALRAMKTMLKEKLGDIR